MSDLYSTKVMHIILFLVLYECETWSIIPVKKINFEY